MKSRSKHRRASLERQLERRSKSTLGVSKKAKALYTARVNYSKLFTSGITTRDSLLAPATAVAEDREFETLTREQNFSILALARHREP